MGASDAINKPKFHHQWLPDMVFAEKGFKPATFKALQAMGYKLNERGAIGRTEIIKITHNPKRSIEAVGDNRGDDAAEGY
jgi:gamma-glutamyltranspeptidase / glutathione hydrolase